MEMELYRRSSELSLERIVPMYMQFIQFIDIKFYLYMFLNAVETRRYFGRVLLKDI